MALDIESITSVIKEGMPALEVLAGSKAIALFLEKISSAIGWYVEPKQIVRKAKAEAAAGLIKAESAQEEKTIEQRAAARIIYEETKQQQNIESIVLAALPGINEDARPNDVDNDWLAHFFDKSRLISNEDIQKLWSQILAGEVNQPGSFSIRTLQLLSTFTKYDAELFLKLNKFVWFYDETEAMAVVPNGIISEDKLSERLSGGEQYYLSDINLVFLHHSGQVTISGEDMRIRYGDEVFSIKNKYKPEEGVRGLPLGYVKLTQIASELAVICKSEPNLEYMQLVIDYWDLEGFSIVKIDK